MKKLLKLKNVSGGAWIRLVLLGAAVTNMALSLLGRNPVMADSTASDVVTIIAAAATALAAYWKNNSFTDAARAADEIMNEMKKSS